MTFTKKHKVQDMDKGGKRKALKTNRSGQLIRFTNLD